MSLHPRLFVTAATGQLGGLVIDTLLTLVPPDAIVAGVRDPASDKAQALRAKGIEIRVADYAVPETLKHAFDGIARLLLISGNALGERGPQHRNVIAAAKTAGVGLIAYTSLLRADSSPLFLAEEHRETEADLVASGVPYVFLRNGWYTEVYTWRLPAALAIGTLNGASGEGRISSAARADYARAAAIVLAGGDHAGRIYELAGDASFTLPELASLVSRTAGKPITCQELTPEALRDGAIAAHVPEIFATILSDTDAGVAKGALFDDGHQLSRLIGRPTTPFDRTIADFMQGQS